MIISFAYDGWMKKVAAQKLAAALVTDHGRVELQHLYEKLDTDGDGQLTSAEWGSGLAANERLILKYFHGCSVSEITEVFDKIDKDHNGSLTWEEFLQGAVTSTKDGARGGDVDMEAERSAWLTLWCSAIAPQSVAAPLRRYIDSDLRDRILNDFAAQEEVALSRSLRENLFTHGSARRLQRTLTSSLRSGSGSASSSESPNTGNRSLLDHLKEPCQPFAEDAVSAGLPVGSSVALATSVGGSSLSPAVQTVPPALPAIPAASLPVPVPFPVHVKMAEPRAEAATELAMPTAVQEEALAHEDEPSEVHPEAVPPDRNPLLDPGPLEWAIGCVLGAMCLKLACGM